VVPIFVGYAMIVWYLTAKHRRRVFGALAVATGLLGLVALNWLHIMLGRWTEGEIYVPVLQTVTYPYTALVVAVGVFIWAIPNRVGEACHACSYDLDGLDPAGGVLVCPECGMKNATRGAYRPSGADRSSFDADDDRRNTAPGFERAPAVAAKRWFREDSGPPPRVVGSPRSAPEQAPRAADQQDREGQPADERPAEQAQPAR
jgi:hypothetical protein